MTSDTKVITTIFNGQVSSLCKSFHKNVLSVVGFICPGKKEQGRCQEAWKLIPTSGTLSLVWWAMKEEIPAYNLLSGSIGCLCSSSFTLEVLQNPLAGGNSYLELTFPSSLQDLTSACKSKFSCF